MSFRDRLDVERLLESLGIKAKKRGVKWSAICPNPDHQDSHPSWSITDDPGSRNHAAHHCFSCKFGGGPWELVMAVRGVDEEAAAEHVTALVSGVARVPEGLPTVVVRMGAGPREYVLPPQVQIPSVDGSEWPPVFLAYLHKRGITDDQIERWSIGFATKGPLRWRVVIPVHTRGRLVAHVGRAIFNDGSVRYDMPHTGALGAVPTMAILGEPLLDPSLGVLTIAEGSFSMFALERAGAPNPVALLGSDWSADKAAILSSVPWRRVLVATDPDMAGDRVAKLIAGSFRTSEVSRVRLDQSPDDCEQGALRERIAEALRSSVC